MDARTLKGRMLAASGKITRGADCYFVPSQSGGGRYRVVLDGLFPHCSRADFEVAGRDCKHMLAARQWSDSGEPPTPDHTRGIKPKPEPRIPRPTYPRDWPTINKAQTTEKHWFQTLLADLCRSIPDPPQHSRRGRPSIPLADGVFAAVFKVYSGFSARRFTCDVQEARERGHIGHAPHFNSVLNVLESETATPVLVDLIARSASPLREVETEFAIDSTGFSTSRFDRWFDLKYGVTRQEAHWIEVHVCSGTTTNAITAVEIAGRDGGDAPQLPKLVEATAKGFRVERVTADKAYPSNANFEAVDKAGGVLYAAFKSNTTGAVGGLFEKAFHYFCLHREEFLRHYHRRSTIESTFSMVKRKFGDGVRSKTDTAMRNEVLAKFVCHNLCCLVSAIYERGIAPAFGLTTCTKNAEAAQILRFPGV